MKGRFAASMVMQQPSDLPVYDVCPECKRETPMFLETRDGKAFEVYRCDRCKMIVNPLPRGNYVTHARK